MSGRYETIEALRKALEDNGIQFLENGETALGAGVALIVEKGDGERDRNHAAARVVGVERDYFLNGSK